MNAPGSKQATSAAPNQIPLQIDAGSDAQNAAEWTQTHYSGHCEPARSSNGEEIGFMKGLKHSQHCCSFFLAISTLSCLIILAISLVYRNTAIALAFGIFAAVCYIAVIVETCCSSSRKYLSHIQDRDTVNEMVIYARNSPPRITWHVQCYHYETRHTSHTVTDSNGNTRTEWRTEQVRVDTHRAKQEFVYKSWDDISAEWDGNVQHQLTKIECEKMYCFANYETQQIYNQNLAAFKAMNHRDVYQECWVKLHVDGFEKRLLAELNPGGSPCCLSAAWFYIWSALLCSCCYRTWFAGIVGRKKYVLVKQISCF